MKFNLVIEVKEGSLHSHSIEAESALEAAQKADRLVAKLNKSGLKTNLGNMYANDNFFVSGINEGN